MGGRKKKCAIIFLRHTSLSQSVSTLLAVVIYYSTFTSSLLRERRVGCFFIFLLPSYATEACLFAGMPQHTRYTKKLRRCLVL